MMTAGVHAFDLKQEADILWTSDRFRGNWDEFHHHQRRANVVYTDARRQLSARSRNVLKNTKCPYK